MEDRAINKSPQEQVEREECDLVQVENELEKATQVLAKDFTKGRIGATMTEAGLQLVRDTQESCARGDPQACERLKLIKRFLEQIQPKGVQSS
jgi:hypothetical protein